MEMEGLNEDGNSTRFSVHSIPPFCSFLFLLPFNIIFP